jgi:hypothetical protein
MPKYNLNLVQQREQARHVTQALSAYTRLAREVVSMGASAKADSNPKRRFTQLARSSSKVSAFLDAFIGQPTDYSVAYSFREKCIYALRDQLLGLKTQAEAEEIITKNAEKSYIQMSVSSAQKNLRGLLPPEIKAFLPENIVIETDDDGSITSMTDVFGNEKDDLQTKVNLVRKIVTDYNKIVKQVKKDLASKNERTKFKAIVTSILMETGIRPGREGNASKVAGVLIETFGAVTLAPEHITFVKSNLAELKFVGKAGTVNVASLSDNAVIRELKNYALKALKGKLKRVFVDRNGISLSHVEINYYFQEYFGSIRPSDLRKYKATEQMFEALKEEQQKLQANILKFVDEEAEDLKERVLYEIVNTLNLAVERAKSSLSHLSGADTVGYYINPDVVLSFLSQGFVDADLKSAIIKNDRTLSFDVDVFVQHALSKRGSSSHNLLSIFTEIENMF